MTVWTGIAAVVMVLGFFFMALGAIGLLRFPDYYTRMHAAGKCDTLGSLLVVLGLALFHLAEEGLLHHGVFNYGAVLVALKLIVIAVFVFLTSPTATHAIARAAFKNRMPLWTREKKR